MNNASLTQSASQEKAPGAAISTPHEKGSLFAAGQISEQGKEVPAGAKPNLSQGREPVAALQKGTGTDNAALDNLRAASSGAASDILQNADAKSEKVQPVTTGAPEKEQRGQAASQGQSQDPAVSGITQATGPEQQTVKVEAAPAAGTPQADQLAQGNLDNKAPRAAMAFHGTYSAARSVTEQTSSKPEAALEEAGSKTAALAGTAKFVPAQESAGQSAFGDAGKKGHPDQKAQASDAASLPQGVGLPAAPAAEAPQPEAKPVNLKSALHESILAQIKDGVVTHDAKGNGQMSIRLNPGELGELKIQVRMDDNRVRIEVQADNKMVKDLLMSNLDSLKDSLNSKNFSMEGFDVSTGGGGFNSPLPEQKGSPRQQSPQRSARAGGYSDQGEPTRVNYLTGEANNLLDVRF